MKINVQEQDVENIEWLDILPDSTNMKERRSDQKGDRREFGKSN